MSFDVSFPTSWKLPKKFIQEDRILEQQSNQENQRLISFISEINEEEIEKTSKNIKSIILYNLEREEKETLLSTKVEELKVLFEKNSLKTLKTLKFEIKTPKIDIQDDEPEFKTPKLVEE